MEQCLFCRGVYSIKDSDASVKELFCAVKCENELDLHQKEAQDWVDAINKSQEDV